MNNFFKTVKSCLNCSVENENTFRLKILYNEMHNELSSSVSGFRSYFRSPSPRISTPGTEHTVLVKALRGQVCLFVIILMM